MIAIYRKIQKSSRLGLLFCGFMAAFALGFALVSQYGFRLYPCELCLLQRWPYGFIIAVALLGALLRSMRLQKNLIIVCALLFLADAGIAFYHTGVELDFFKGPDGCSAAAAGEQTLEEMRAAIMSAPLVTCKQAMASLMGLSMAAWNGIYALAAAALTLLLWRKL